MIDIHCHIIPGVDDGPRTFSESVDMLKEARRSGIDHIVCTPHCRWDDFDFDLIRLRYLQLRDYAERLGIKLDLGFEVHWAKLMEMGIEVAPSLCISGTNAMLLEFSSSFVPSNWQSFVYRLQGMGLEIIVAHPERYRAVQNNLDIAQEMHDMGCLLQLSANFVKDGFAGPRKKAAMRLLRAGIVDYIASDAHGPEDYRAYRKAVKMLGE